MSAKINDGVVISAAVAQDGSGIGEVFALACAEAYEGILPEGFMRRYQPEVQAEVWVQRIEALHRSYAIKVAMVDNLLVGFIHLGPASGSSTAPEGWGEVHHLFVRPELSRRGVGSCLMAAGRSWFANQRYRHAVLWVFEENVAAQCFYESVGWRSNGFLRLDPGLCKVGIYVRERRYHVDIPLRDEAMGRIGAQ